MWIIGAIIAILVAALVIWIVGKLNLGLEVAGFGPAISAAVVIVIVSMIVRWLLGLIGLGDGSGIIAAIKDRLANFKVPKWVYLVDELPRNAMGKVQKNILRKTYSPMKAR